LGVVVRSITLIRRARARQAIGGFQAAVSTGRIFEPARLEFEIVIDAT
jgi:hypothetical protein